MTTGEQTAEPSQLPKWELALHDESASRDDSIPSFVNSRFAMQLVALDVESSAVAVLDLVLRAKRRIDERLGQDQRYDELRARLAAVFILWRIQDAPVGPDVWAAYRLFRSSKRNDGRQDWRAFRQALARCRYRNGPDEATGFADLKRDDDTSGASTAFRQALRDALSALLYTLAVGGEVTDYWEPSTNTLVRPKASESIPIPRDFRDRMVERLRRAPEHYPPHLDTKQLEELVETEVVDRNHSSQPASGLPTPRLTETDTRWRVLRTPSARIYVTGVPGSGKSTILRAATIKAIERKQTPAAVFVSMSGLATQITQEASLTKFEAVQILLDEAHRVYGHLDSPERDYLADAILNNPAALVCLDGLDEVAGGEPLDRILRFIRSLRSARCKIVISSRPSSRLRLDDAWMPIVTLQIGRKNARRVLELWFPTEGDPRRHAALTTLDLHLNGGSGTTPLLLGFVAYVSEFERTVQSRGQLFEQYINLTLERIWKSASEVETDDLSIFSLRRAACHAAWSMATGRTARTRGSDQWLNEASLEELIRVAPSTDAPSINRLVSSEGLLGVAEVRAARLQTKYAWTHRSIHESLVGDYLANLYRTSREDGMKEILGRVGVSESWQLAVSHMIDVLEVEDFRKIAVVLLDIIALDDGITDSEAPIQVLIGSLQLDAEQTAFIEREAVKRGLRSGFVDDTPSGRQKLIEDANSGLYVNPDRVFTIHEKVGFDAEFLEELTTALLHHPRTNGDLLYMLAASLEEISATTSALAYLRLCEFGLLGYPQYSPRLSGSVDTSQVIYHVSKAKWPEPRWRMVRLLETWGMDLKAHVSADGPLLEEDVYIHEVIGGFPVSDPRIFARVATEVVSGVHGDMLAYLSARGPAPVVEMAKTKWAIAGAWEQGMVNNPSALLPYLPEQIKSQAAFVIENYRAPWRANPDRMILFLMALLVSMDDPVRVRTSALVEAYRRIVCDLHRREFDYVELQMEHAALLKVFTSVFKSRGLEEAVSALVDTNPETWQDSEGQIPLIDAFVRAEAPEDPNVTESSLSWNTALGFYGAAEWAARANIPLLVSLNNPLEIQRLDPLDVLANFSQRVLTVRGNVEWLDHRFTMFSQHVWPVIRTDVLTSVEKIRLDGGESAPTDTIDPLSIEDLRRKVAAYTGAPAPPRFWLAEREDGCWYYSSYGEETGQMVIRYEVEPTNITKVVKGVLQPMSPSEVERFVRGTQAYFKRASEEIYFDVE